MPAWPNPNNPRHRRSYADAQYARLSQLTRAAENGGSVPDNVLDEAFTAAAVAVDNLGESKKAKALREKLLPPLARTAMNDPYTATMARIVARVVCAPYHLHSGKNDTYGVAPRQYQEGIQSVPNYTYEELCTRVNGRWFRNTTVERYVSVWLDDGTVRKAWGMNVVSEREDWSLSVLPDGSLDPIATRQLPAAERQEIVATALAAEAEMERLNSRIPVPA
jgi:hypothetical protein